ncbi:MAG: pyridoxine 5'-phosphate synthase [Gammaproteobacteria bacterium]|nr:pyridoxine 5'-phosphate synthase [Gammaproteobacteria bacterium]
MNQIYLGVNVDHVATVREARKINYPDPLFAALIAEQAGADLITIHLREDRRHIQDQDVSNFKNNLKTRLNLELAAEPEMLSIAEQVKPEQCCLVPEKRSEVTTEGGLDVAGNKSKIKAAVTRLKEQGIRVSLFINPIITQIEAAKECGADDIEIHTGSYALACNLEQERILKDIKSAVNMGLELGLRINAGHGLHYHNVGPIAAIIGVTELNIGHAIIARAITTGMDEAVRTMKKLMNQARSQAIINLLHK